MPDKAHNALTEQENAVCEIEALLGAVDVLFIERNSAHTVNELLEETRQRIKKLQETTTDLYACYHAIRKK